MKRYGGLCSAFVLGAAFGSAVSLLFAPQSGRRTRRLIRRKTETGVDYLTDRTEGMVEKGREALERGKEVATDKVRVVERSLKAVGG